MVLSFNRYFDFDFKIGGLNMLNRLLKEHHDFSLILLGVIIGLLFSSFIFWFQGL
ncbi:hypothetical protein ADEMBY_22 [Bacillus phage Ademby]|nr:hypothetical protein ADEMBY_22 [Bacillus phage Ademby]